jgi:hypothetical protein
VDFWRDTTQTYTPWQNRAFFRGEAAFLIQAFPWETEFMNIALWSPRGAQARERTRGAGATDEFECLLCSEDNFAPSAFSSLCFTIF